MTAGTETGLTLLDLLNWMKFSVVVLLIVRRCTSLLEVETRCLTATVAVMLEDA